MRTASDLSPETTPLGDDLYFMSSTTHNFLSAVMLYLTSTVVQRVCYHGDENKRERNGSFPHLITVSYASTSAILTYLLWIRNLESCFINFSNFLNNLSYRFVLHECNCIVNIGNLLIFLSLVTYELMYLYLERFFLTKTLSTHVFYLFIPH